MGEFPPGTSTRLPLLSNSCSSALNSALSTGHCLRPENQLRLKCAPPAPVQVSHLDRFFFQKDPELR